MKIALLSPRHKQGLSTASILLAQTIAHTTTLRVHLTYTGGDYKSYLEYLGLDYEEDKTRTTSQMVKLIETGSLSHAELEDYMIKIEDRFLVLNTSSDITTEEDSETLISYVLSNEDDNGTLTVIDVNTELDDDITQKIIKESDLVIIVAEQTRLSSEMAKRWMKSDYIEDDSKVVFIFNLFDPYVMSSRETAKMFGIRYRRTSKISYNPYIKKFCNERKLDNLLTYIKRKDERVFELNADLLECARLIGNQLGFHVEWRGLS